MVWWFLFSSTTQKSGDFSVQSAASAAAAAVTAKIEKNEKKSYNILILTGDDFKYDISFPFRIPPYPNKGAFRGLRGAGEGGLKPLKII